jgi:4-azaleucine resistance transporter AzlC
MNSTTVVYSRIKTFAAAFRYSVPVLLGFLAIGAAYGLLLVDSGYPWWLAPLSGVVIYAGSGQFLAVGLFAAGVGLWETLFAELVLNARHIAYGISLFKRINSSHPFRWYLVFALTDETFALLSSLPEEEKPGVNRNLLMFYIAVLDQFYWVAGSAIGAIAGSLIPFNLEGIGFTLTALFIVLMCEQVLRVKKPGPFIIAAAAAILAVVFLPARFALLASLAAAIAVVRLSGSGGLSGNPVREADDAEC